MIKKASFLLLSLAFIACNSSEPKGDNQSIIPANKTSDSFLPSSNGGRMDIIVVAKESLWQTAAGDAFRKYFTVEQAGLPQPESLFNVRQVEPREFNDLLKRSRTVVVLEKGADLEKAYAFQRNQWAKPQLVFSFKGKTPEEIAELVQQQQADIIKKIKAHEIKVLQARLKKGGFQKPPKMLAQHNVSLNIPKTFKLDQENENLLVFWNKTFKTDQGIIVHFEPLDEDLASIGTNTIPLRDSITKRYIQGAQKGSYMATEMLVPPTITQTELAGQFTLETRGLWKTVNDFMGGAFINYTVYDEKNKQIIFLDAFLYSPETQKRKFVLELEATLKSLTIL